MDQPSSETPISEEETTLSSALPPMEREERLISALHRVRDPELDLPVTAMGLIYGAKRDDDGTAAITMTLTTVGCPLFDVIRDHIAKELMALDDISDVEITLVFDPPWSPEMMNDAAKAAVGLLP